MSEEKKDQTPEAGGEEKHVPLPLVDFNTFVLSLASSALVQLGEVPSPDGGETVLELEHAKYTIDILSMLQEKTETGLKEDEKRLLHGLLYELRMKYVLKAK